MNLIINADDFGLTKATNLAIEELAKLGIITSTTVMVNMPYAKEVSSLKTIKVFSIGLHLNFTEGTPLSDPNDIGSLVDKSGRFFSYETFIRKLYYGQIKKADMEIELEAQFRRLEAMIGRKPDHIDSHQNIHKQYLVAKTLLDFGKRNPGLGLRNPQRFFLKEHNASTHIFDKSGNGIGLKHIRAKIINRYFKWLASKYKTVFALPDGELHHPSHKKIDFLNWVISCSNLPQTDAVFEIPCHPAMSSEGLGSSKLTDKRVKEYELMRSDDFLNALSKFTLLSFREIKE